MAADSLFLGEHAGLFRGEAPLIFYGGIFKMYSKVELYTGSIVILHAKIGTIGPTAQRLARGRASIRKTPPARL